MTGFGRGVAEQGNVRATVDLRAVNHRFLDLKLRAQVMPALEEQIAGRIRAAIERGSVTVSIHIARHAAAAGPRIDEVAARAAHGQLALLAKSLGIAGPELALVLAQPGVVLADEPGSDSEMVDALILTALDAAIGGLQQMRAVEGRVLERDLAMRLDELGKLRGTIVGLAAGVTEHVQKKLAERLRRLLGDESNKSGSVVDPARLAQEVALLAERADITEELVRLASHLEQAGATIGGLGASGRKLDFLVQEIGRELNTIGSKSQVTEISSAVVEAKAVLEKVREQVQNVE
jgi:uncharacterized protein (TIGR00255 family)